MTRDEFIEKWQVKARKFITPLENEVVNEMRKEFMSDLDDMMTWYKHELWDQWNK